MNDLNDKDRFYSLLSIFKLFSTTDEFKLLSSPALTQPFWVDESGPMQRALKHLLQNFQKQVYMKDLLELTNMSNTSFYATFKRTYRMSFKDYLVNIRVGYACKLLTDKSKNISEIAFDSGFENISNFNRHFKKIKGITPSQFQEQINIIENTHAETLELSTVNS